ncbi:hemolysin activation/secretion protein [Neorhizobium galegae]|uniref:ShlB/FhaC/HecB family hemolysin secretion/activation protein n=1 Tax=Neorhizobium galegae TaxID=399 RepID=UPI001AE73D7E|nr:ShlB/FhaC/HecB family hemolysin secretion/activation protein [Neorhizobium galegae]MBP2551845.1 hemolysin activation/secretion protein [Neorhizobium galegae]
MTAISRPHLRLLLATSFAIAVAPLAALGQTAGQLVAPTYAPNLQRPGGGLELLASNGLETPPGAEQLFVTPAGLEVEGGLPAMAATTREIEARLRGHRVSGADLFAAARDLERAYAEAGYVLVRVSLPPQTIVDHAPLRLLVTDGFIQRVDTTGVPAGVRPRVDAYAAPLVGRTGITRAQIERQLLLAGDTPGLALRSTIKAGDKTGAAILVLEGRYDPVAVTLSAGNGQSDALGDYTVGIGADLNNLAGLGEISYFRFSGYPGLTDGHLFAEYPRNRQMVAGILLPLGFDGMALNVEATDSRNRPDNDDLLEIDDHYRRLSTRLSYQWIRSRAFNTATELSLDVIDERQTLDFGGTGSPFTRDSLRVVRLGQSFDSLTAASASIDGRVTASFGLDALGARSATADLPLTRAGAEPDFQKLDASLRYRQALLKRLDFTAAVRGQASFGQALPSSEQIGLGGSGALSSFDSSSLQGDSGVMARLDLALPMPLVSRSPDRLMDGVWAPYVFAAAGIVELAAPTALEHKVIRGASLGLGIKLNLAETPLAGNSLLTLEYAHGWADGEDQSNRLLLNTVFRF